MINKIKPEGRANDQKNGVIYCKVCGKEIDTFKYIMEDYCYKVFKNNRFYIFCSYSCQIKFEKAAGIKNSHYRFNKA